LEQLQLRQELLVFGVRSDPEPDDGIAFLDRQCPISQSDACGEDGTLRMDLLEAETRVLGIALEELVSET
jgi:hypothetical protein